jgi:putative endopeptidase
MLCTRRRTDVRRLLLAVMLIGVALGAHHARADRSPAQTASTGLDLSWLDPSCKPCENFFQFANGGWLRTHEIPAAYPAWGLFNELQQKNQQVLHELLEQAAAEKAPAGSLDQKLGDFYRSCMDTRQIDAAGLGPLRSELRRIEAIRSRKALEAELARLHRRGVSALFRFGPTEDFKNSSQEIAEAAQGGLGLPDRDDYLKDDEPTRRLRDQYRQHVERMLHLLGEPDAQARADAEAVLRIETSLAQASMSRVELRQPENTYHKIGLAEVQQLTPHFSWKRYLREVGVESVAELNVVHPGFFRAMDRELASVPLEQWKAYLRWHLVHALATAMPTAFEEENFNFYGRVLTGAQQQRPRWQRCVEATDRLLGEALGQKYVERAFPPAAKEAALRMVRNLMAALRQDLETLDWMSPETRQAALDKLDRMTVKIGYPDHWRDYGAFHVVRGPYVVNVLAGRAFQFQRDLAKIGRPVDRTEWDMTPPTVNAYYNPPRNEIVFPAGILQPPFFDPAADDALNYGGIGAVIGHEMTHGFDDEGRKFDARGNLRDWWTPEDARRFTERAECVARQFDSYVALDDLHENGHLVLGESIADLGGLTIAYRAFAMTPEFRSGKKLQGLTPAQWFFLAYARIWAEKERPEYIRLMVHVNPHPLARFRVIGPLANLPEFAHAFGCKHGDPMVRPAEQRCRIW